MPEKTFEEQILPVRNEIDRIDKQLLPLFLQRMQCTEKVAEIKRAAGQPILNTAREQVILDRVKAEAGGEYGESAAALYRSIMAISRARQHAMLNTGAELRALEQNSPRALMENPRVLCQGVPGAFSHTAAKQLFPAAEPQFLPTFSEVFEAVKNGDADYGVVPVENSDAGSVVEVYDLILRHRMYIVLAGDVAIRQCLCRAKGTGKVTRAISKQEALMQCTGYLEANGIKAESYSNTAAAARDVAARREEGLGAICSADAAEAYGLEIVAENIQNTAGNTTRFAVIAREAVLPDDAEKISLCFSLPNVTGSLAQTLEEFVMAGLNLTKIESRPIPERSFEYDFYLDFLGNLHDPKTLALICSLSEEVPRFSFLGNYREV